MANKDAPQDHAWERIAQRLGLSLPYPANLVDYDVMITRALDAVISELEELEELKTQHKNLEHRIINTNYRTSTRLQILEGALGLQSRRLDALQRQELNPSPSSPTDPPVPQDSPWQPSPEAPPPPEPVPPAPPPPFQPTHYRRRLFDPQGIVVQVEVLSSQAVSFRTQDGTCRVWSRDTFEQVYRAYPASETR